ncbi:heterokaryon incompatibility protein-domain-containing protein [Xylaria cf. heliscus]|nr:heterokaryon incompatibility protein-domain-containing protein [Xylaria cf. heliscus]
MSSLCASPCRRLYYPHPFGYYNPPTRTFSEVEQGRHTCPLCACLYASLTKNELDLLNETCATGNPVLVALLRLNQGIKIVYCRLTITWDTGNITKTFTASVDPVDSLYLQRPAWTNIDHASFGERLPVVKDWLRDCRLSHSHCNLAPSTQKHNASRFIDLSQRNGSLDARLVTGDVGEYVALSHCWGGIDITCKTTRNNIEEYRNRISYDSLPKTFQEAIDVARALQIHNLWIDSLCIIQDDREDWEIEAAKMMNVYQGATITFSATSAKSSLDGLGITNSLKPSFRFHTDDAGGTQWSLFPEATSSVIWGFGNLPVQSRGWILQEQTLSQRILHFTHDEMIWQCHHLIELESGRYHSEYNHGVEGSWTGKSKMIQSGLWQPISPTYVPLRENAPSGSTGSTMLSNRNENMWWSLVVAYCQRSLTNRQDIFAAMAGVTQLHEERCNDVPILGLWREKLVFWLTWERGPLAESTLEQVSLVEKAHAQQLPSWTWMSLPLPYFRANHTMPFTTSEYFNKTPCARVGEPDISWPGRPLISTPTKAMITVHGVIFQIGWKADSGTYGIGIDFEIQPFHRRQNKGMSLDICDPQEHLAYTAVALWTEDDIDIEWGDVNRTIVHALLIEAISQTRDQYRRIGIVSIHFDKDKHRIEDLGVEKAITLV